MSHMHDEEAADSFFASADRVREALEEFLSPKIAAADDPEHIAIGAALSLLLLYAQYAVTAACKPSSPKFAALLEKTEEQIQRHTIRLVEPIDKRSSAPPSQMTELDGVIRPLLGDLPMHRRAACLGIANTVPKLIAVQNPEAFITGLLDIYLRVGKTEEAE